MKFKLIFIILITVFFKSFLISQIVPYVPIEFIDYTPKWIHIPIDSTLIDNERYDGMNHFTSNDFPLPLLLEKDYMYITANTIVKNENNQKNAGGLIEKIDVNTGQTVWSSYFDSRNNDRDEYIESIFYNENKDLEVITDRRIKNDKYWGNDALGDTAVLSRWVFNKNTGEILGHNYIDSKDTLAKTIKFSKHNRRLLYHQRNGNFQYFRTDGLDYSLSILDENGRILKSKVTDTIKFEKYYDFDSIYVPAFNRMKKINDDTLITLDLIYDRYKREKFDRQTRINLYNKKLEITKSLSIDSLLPDRFDFLRIYTSNDKYFSLFGRFKEYYVKRDTLFYRFFDYDGNLIRHFTSIYNNENVFFKYTYLEIEKEFLIVALDRYFTKLIFLKPKEDGTFEFVKEFYFKDNGRAFIPRLIMQLKNGDILMKGKNSNKVADITKLQQWNNWVCISAKDLGLKSTSIVEAIKDLPEIKIYPNPTKDILNIEFQDSFEGNVEVKNELGQSILKKKIEEVINLKLDVSSLISGIYFIEIHDFNGQLIYKINSFIKE